MRAKTFRMSSSTMSTFWPSKLTGSRAGRSSGGASSGRPSEVVRGCAWPAPPSVPAAVSSAALRRRRKRETGPLRVSFSGSVGTGSVLCGSCPAGSSPLGSTAGASCAYPCGGSSAGCSGR